MLVARGRKHTGIKEIMGLNDCLPLGEAKTTFLLTSWGQCTSLYYDTGKGFEGIDNECPAGDSPRSVIRGIGKAIRWGRSE